jgi:hypothetical protein
MKKTLGNIIDENIDAIQFLKYLNNIIPCLGSNYNDSYEHNKAMESISSLLKIGIEAVNNDVLEAKAIRTLSEALIKADENNDTQIMKTLKLKMEG